MMCLERFQGDLNAFVKTVLSQHLNFDWCFLGLIRLILLGDFEMKLFLDISDPVLEP